MQEEEAKKSSDFMMSFFEKQEAASDMSIDQTTSISEIELGVFQEPEVSFMRPEDTDTLSSEEQEKNSTDHTRCYSVLWCWPLGVW